MPKQKKKGVTGKAIATSVIELELKYSGGLQFKKALVNGVKVPFVGGVARFGVVEASDHELQWEVVGFVGTKWSFKLVTDTEGYEISPKALSDPGKAYTLEQTIETPRFTFSVRQKTGEASE